MSGQTVATNPAHSFGFTAVICALMAAEAASAFESTMTNIALPDMMAHFGVGVGPVGWTLTAFFLVAGVSAGICGRIGDLYGRKKVLIGLLVCATAGSGLSLIGDSLLMVIAGRALQGVAGAVLPLTIALARQWTPAGSSRGTTGLAAVAAAATLGGAGGGLIAGVLVDRFGWQALFVFSGVLAALALLVVVVVVPKDLPTDPDTTERLDVVGAALLVPAAGLLMLAVTSGRDWGWTSTGVLGAGGAGLALAAIWTWWELRTTDPLIRLRDFTDRHLAFTLLASLASCAPIGIIPVLTTIVMLGPTSTAVGLGLSPSLAGAITCGAALITCVLIPLLGRIAARRGAGQVLLLGAALIGASLVGIVAGHSSAAVMTAVAFLVAGGLLFTSSALPILVAESAPEERMASITGATVVVRATFTAMATAIGVTLLASSTSPGTDYPDVTGLLRAVLVVALGTLLMAMCAVVLRRRRTAPVTTAATPTETAVVN